MAVVLVLAVGAALVRLLPWLLSPEVPLPVALPFAKALLAVAFEAAYFVGVPAGCALGAAIFVERGEARALHCQGASPFGLATQSVPLLILAGALAFATSSLWQANTEHPGRFARALVEHAREGCAGATPRSVSVPIVGVTWLCFRDGPPRLTGPVPNSDGRAWFSARAIDVSDDFTAFRAEDVFVGSQPTASNFRVAVRARVAHVSGLPAWGQSTPLGPPLRASVVGLTVLLLGLASVFVVLKLGVSQLVLAGGIAGLAGVVSLRVLHVPLASGPFAAAASVLAVGLGVSCTPLLLVPWARRLHARLQ
ncbi:MAG TPA: hypothetical protein VFU02_19490 [Polyangiaceae bacterium]|nr:hypothetical protein [Polyangiaceae bacterium]